MIGIVFTSLWLSLGTGFPRLVTSLQPMEINFGKLILNKQNSVKIYFRISRESSKLFD